MANDNITGNNVVSSDFVKVLLALKDNTLRDCHVLELGIIKEINNDNVICDLLSNPSIKVQAIKIGQINLNIGQLVLIGFNDNDFKTNLNKFNSNESLQEIESKERHKLTNGIIITNFQNGSSIKLYNSTGQNTDGAMTQKATTDELNNRLEKSNLTSRLYCTGPTAGEQVMLNYSIPATNYSIPRRTNNGNIQVALEPTDPTHATSKQYVDSVAKALPIGSIIMGAMPLNDASVHLLDGSTISQIGIYADFATLLKTTAQTYTQITCTQAQFDADVARTGNCGRFVIDNINNTIRLPKITRFVQGINSLTDIGTSLSAGLPNITGSFDGRRIGFYAGSGEVEGGATGAFSAFVSNKQASNYVSDYKSIGYNFNASNSNAIYGNSTTVQPESTQYPYYIILASSAKTSIEVDIDQVASDLNLKLGKADIARYPIQTWHSSDYNTWYIIYNDGWKECGGTFINSTSGNILNYAVTFPLTFSHSPNISGCKYIDTTYSSSSSSATNDTIANRTLHINTITTSGFKISYFSPAYHAQYYACGY